MLFRVGPRSKLLAIIAEYDHRVGEAVGNVRANSRSSRAVRRTGSGTAAARCREDVQHAAVVFGQVVAVQLIGRQSGVLEVEIVQDRVLDARVHQIAGQRLFPHAFRHPHALHGGVQTRFEPLRVSLDLADAIARWNHRQNRLVIGAADDLDAPGGHQTRRADRDTPDDARRATPAAGRWCAAKICSASNGSNTSRKGR